MLVSIGHLITMEQMAMTCNKKVASKVVYLARLKTVIASVRHLSRGDRYRLYMSMMGHDPYIIDGDDWAYTLHRMVGGRHNLDEYQRQADQLEVDLFDVYGLDELAVKRLYEEIYRNDEHFLDPALDLVYTKIGEFYSYAGRPA